MAAENFMDRMRREHSREEQNNGRTEELWKMAEGAVSGTEKGIEANWARRHLSGYLYVVPSGDSSGSYNGGFTEVDENAVRFSRYVRNYAFVKGPKELEFFTKIYTALLNNGGVTDITIKSAPFPVMETRVVRGNEFGSSGELRSEQYKVYDSFLVHIDIFW